MAFVVIQRSDGIRSAIEDAIRRLYWSRYGAALCSFAKTIIAEVSQSDTIECAAGVRFTDEALFLECYLDQPIERALSSHLVRAVERDRIVEVCHLAAISPGRSLPFIEKLISYLGGNEVDWAIFTATKPLRSLLKRNGLTMLELAPALRSRVPYPEGWGNYFAHDPRVMAISRHAATGTGALISRATRVCPDAPVF